MTYQLNVGNKLKTKVRYKQPLTSPKKLKKLNILTLRDAIPFINKSLTQAKFPNIDRVYIKIWRAFHTGNELTLELVQTFKMVLVQLCSAKLSEQLATLSLVICSRYYSLSDVYKGAWALAPAPTTKIVPQAPPLAIWANENTYLR